MKTAVAVDEETARWYPRVERRVFAGVDLEERRVEHHRDHAALDRLLRRVVQARRLATGALGGLHAAHPELLRIVVRFVERGLASGELESILPPALVGSLALVQITAPVPYWFRHPKLDLHGLINDAVDHWLHGAIASPRSQKQGQRK